MDYGFVVWLKIVWRKAQRRFEGKETWSGQAAFRLKFCRNFAFLNANRKNFPDMEERPLIKVRQYPSPCGVLLLGSFGDRLCLCDWQAGRHHDRVMRRLARALRATFSEGTSAVVECAAAQLDAFFAGERRLFDVPLLFVGTGFQKTVWDELLKIPFGHTVSYGEVAMRIGKPTAVRAVANANGANALSIFVPCHRVIGGDHSLTGYGGGLPAKRMLLALEGRIEKAGKP